MKPFIVVLLTVLTCGLTQSYSVYGNKRHNSANVEPMMQINTHASQQQQHYEPGYERLANTNYQPQYVPVPYLSAPQPLVAEDYNYNSRSSAQNPNYYYYPRQEYQSQLYGIPTYRGDYQAKPYYFAQPSYSSDDRVEATNPLDYLHEEILQENERERSLNNAAFMQNLALYNKQVDSLKSRQQQLQKFQELYNLKATNDLDDYDIEQPSDWYDQTSILVDPNTFESYKSDYEMMPQASSQYAYQSRPKPNDYDDEMVKELRDLTKAHKSPVAKDYGASQSRQTYGNIDWQQDMPQESEDVTEPEYDEDDEWINWDQKRDIQPKKDFALIDAKQTQQSVNKLPDVKAKPLKPTITTQTPFPSSATENSKLISKLHKGQKEVVLPRPATPVRRPFTESVMNMVRANSDGDGKARKSEQTPPIYKTIKQIIDMEQNLSHVSV